MAVNVSFVQAGGYAASVNRMANSALLVKAGAANKARGGLLPFNGTELLPGPSTPTPNMQTVTTPGSAVIADSAGGAYVVTSDATETRTHAAANATNPRTDLVILRVWDNEAGDAAATTPLVLPGSAGSVNVQTVTGTVEIVTGVAGVGAPVPALPTTRCVVLAQVTVPANATSITAGNIATTAATGRPGRTVATGGILPVLTEAEIAGLTQYDGQLYYPADTDRLLRSKAGAAAVLADPSAFTAGQAYVPVWSGESGGSAVLGTGGSLVGRFKQVGKMVEGGLSMLIGTSAVGPSGVWNWTLPVTAALPLGANVDVPIGTAYYYGGTIVVGGVFARYSSAGARMILWFHGQTAAAQAGNPSTWPATTRMSLQFAYEAA